MTDYDVAPSSLSTLSRLLIDQFLPRSLSKLEHSIEEMLDLGPLDSNDSTLEQDWLRSGPLLAPPSMDSTLDMEPAEEALLRPRRGHCL